MSDTKREVQNFKVMTIRSLSVCYFALLALQTVRADVSLNAPGIAVGRQSASGVPFRNTDTLSDCYKFIFLGTEAKGSTSGSPGASSSKGNGGVINYKAFVSAKKSSTSPAQAVQLTFRNIETFNLSPLQTLLLNPSVEFKANTTAIDVDLVWQGEGNGKQPSGFFNILGEYQKDPPVPTGSLYFPNGAWELKSASSDPNPKGTATVVRK